MANAVFTQAKKVLLDRSDSGGGVDFDTDTLNMALVSALPSQANIDAWNFYSELANEVVGAGYVAGGATVTITGVTADSTNHRASVGASTIAWAASTITAVGGVLFKSTGVAGTSRLIALFDFGGTFVSTGGTFSLTINASGLLLLT